MARKSVRDKDRVWATLGSTVTDVPKGEEHLVVMMDVNARTGGKGNNASMERRWWYSGGVR